MKYSVLVTGGAGFIGSNLAIELQKYYNVDVLDNFETYGNLENLCKFNCDINNTIINIDIRNIENINNKYKYIFHQAAISDTRYKNSEKLFDVNYFSFIKLIRFASRNNSKIIYASSAAQYNDNGDIKASNDYATSKYLMDEYIHNSEYDNIVGLRYFNVYGPGERYKRNTSSLIYQWTKKILNNNILDVFSDSCDTFRDFVFISDIVQANIDAIQLEKNVYDVGTGISTSFLEVLKLISKKLNKTPNINIIHNPYSDYQKFTQAKNSIITNPIKLEEGIDIYIEHIKKEIDESFGYR